MSSIASVSSQDLKSRRQQLKRRRQIRVLQALWRLLLVSSLAGSLVWVVSRPNWVIHRAEQIDIEGNELLTAASIRDLVPLTYPQPLLHLEPQVLSAQIAATVPIAEASVTRKLLPPSLTITVKERRPVAIVLREAVGGNVGLVDEQGVWLPKEHYSALEASGTLPKLVVLGFSDEVRPVWSELYATVRQAALEIFELDLRNPTNLILNTELGLVHCGPYSPHQFPEQLRVLAQMRELPTHVASDRIAYIDLKVPQSPAIQLR